MNKKQNVKSNKKLAILALLLLTTIVSTMAFSYWTESVAGNTHTSQANINIGAGATAQTTVNVVDPATSTKVLVPAGKKAISADPANSVETIEYTFNVSWSSDVLNAAKGTVADLGVEVKNVKIGTTAHGALVNTSINAPATIVADGDVVAVKITVTLTEPETKAIYDQIKNQPITFDVVFTAEV